MNTAQSIQSNSPEDHQSPLMSLRVTFEEWDAAVSEPHLEASLFDGMFFEGVVEALSQTDWVRPSQLRQDSAAQQQPEVRTYRRPAVSGNKVVRATDYFYSDEPRMIG